MQHNIMRKVEANLVDEDEVELKNFCHSTKKFLLRYVVSVSAIMNLYGMVACWDFSLICSSAILCVKHFLFPSPLSLIMWVILFATN